MQQQDRDRTGNRSQGRQKVGQYFCKVGGICVLPLLLAACSNSSISSGPARLNETVSGMSLTLTPKQVNKSILKLTEEREARQGIASRLTGD